jgi:hypothetical protein
MLKSGTIVCACTDTTDECIALVREWCKSNGYTGDDVKVVKRDGQTLAELKRDMWGDIKDTAYDRSK